MTRSVASTGAVLASCFAVAVFFLVAPATPAQEPGDPIEGVITSVDEHTVVVSSEEGREVTVRVGPRTRVFVRGRGPEAGPDFLRPGMRVRFRYDTAMLNRLHVTDLPPGVSPPEGAADEPSGREVKARLVRIDRAGALSADVAGRTERYRLKDPAMLRSFDPGETS